MRDRLRHLPLELAVCGVAGVLATVIGWLAGGGTAALGTAAGVALVLVSYLVSTLAIAWADSVNPRLVLPVGMAAYVTKFSLFGVVLVLLLNSGWAGLTPMAVGIVVGVVAWTGTQIFWTARITRAPDAP